MRCAVCCLRALCGWGVGMYFGMFFSGTTKHWCLTPFDEESGLDQNTECVCSLMFSQTTGTKNTLSILEVRLLVQWPLSVEIFGGLLSVVIVHVYGISAGKKSIWVPEKNNIEPARLSHLNIFPGPKNNKASNQVDKELTAVELIVSSFSFIRLSCQWEKITKWRDLDLISYMYSYLPFLLSLQAKRPKYDSDDARANEKGQFFCNICSVDSVNRQVNSSKNSYIPFRPCPCPRVGVCLLYHTREPSDFFTGTWKCVLLLHKRDKCQGLVLFVLISFSV